MDRDGAKTWAGQDLQPLSLEIPSQAWVRWTTEPCPSLRTNFSPFGPRVLQRLQLPAPVHILG